MYRIYKITNMLDNKVYVGFTSQTIEERFERHVYSDTNFYIHNAIKKYGQTNFHIEEIYSSENRDLTQNVMEPYFINECKSHYTQGGYNMTWGGEGIIMDEEMKKKIGNGNRGKKRTDEQLEKLSVAHLGQTAWNKGLTGLPGPTKETRQKRSKSMLATGHKPPDHSGRITITNGIEEKRVFKNYPIPDDWRRGRVRTWSTKRKN